MWSICQYQKNIYLPGSWIEFHFDILSTRQKVQYVSVGCTDAQSPNYWALCIPFCLSLFLLLCPWCWKPPYSQCLLRRAFLLSVLGLAFPFRKGAALSKSQQGFFWIEPLSPALRALWGLIRDNTVCCCGQNYPSKLNVMGCWSSAIQQTRFVKHIDELFAHPIDKMWGYF